MSKAVKITIAVVLVLVAIVVIYFLLRKGASGNRYGSADAVAAGTKGTYGAYNAAYTAQDVTPAVVELKNKIAGDYSAGISNAEAYGQAWFKGMNIAFTAANVNRYGNEAKKFADNSSLRRENWNVAIGEFLTDTGTAV